jgi:poly-gamma-glutamate synthesis protein (capsule biosynthesis protein)
VEDNLRSIREARRTADWVVLSLHSHEFGGRSALTAARRTDLVEPADFTAAFARAAVDAGADVVVGHGSHVPLGIELYKGRPILHSVGNLIFQTETIPAFPTAAYNRHGLGPAATPSDFHDARTDGGRRGLPASPEFWENIVVRCAFRKGKLAELRIHPVDQGYGRSRAQRGRPVLANGTVAARVLARMQRLCRRYKVTVNIQGSVGIVRP